MLIEQGAALQNSQGIHILDYCLDEDVKKELEEYIHKTQKQNEEKEKSASKLSSDNHKQPEYLTLARGILFNLSPIQSKHTTPSSLNSTDSDLLLLPEMFLSSSHDISRQEVEEEKDRPAREREKSISATFSTATQGEATEGAMGQGNNTHPSLPSERIFQPVSKIIGIYNFHAEQQRRNAAVPTEKPANQQQLKAD